MRFEVRRYELKNWKDETVMQLQKNEDPLLRAMRRTTSCRPQKKGRTEHNTLVLVPYRNWELMSGIRVFCPKTSRSRWIRIVELLNVGLIIVCRLSCIVVSYLACRKIATGARVVGFWVVGRVGRGAEP